MLVGISTSANSENIIRAIDAARAKGNRSVSVANIRSTIFYETALARAAKLLFFKRGKSEK
ncbi:hypothetical protein CE195_06390 [Sodalis-like symbiont of Philaenus spumarius]|nr:hypothetical protein CE195_06390 [Sodalis-like symbiont of Philaenus spumarius]